jgi:hypothetical protein
MNGNGNTTSRALYFDFEYNNPAFELISINHTCTGGNVAELTAAGVPHDANTAMAAIPKR